MSPEIKEKSSNLGSITFQLHGQSLIIQPLTFMAPSIMVTVH